MLSFKLVLCFYFALRGIHCHYLHEYDKKNVEETSSISTEMTSTDSTSTTVISTEFTSTPNIPENSCPEDKSQFKIKDIKVFVDYLYNQSAIDTQLSKAYKSQAIAMRDNYIQELTKFIEWFKHQPEHLKHVLNSISQVRVQHIEPIIKKITSMLNSFPELDKHIKYTDKVFHKLLKKQKRYETVCSYNCDDKQERSIFTRLLQNEYYCSSLEELHNKINNKLNETVKHLKETIMKKLSSDNKNYKDSIQSVKNNLTDRALQDFGRTMYNILFLQDQYHHFVEDLNITAVEKNIFSLKELSVQLDDKLLQLDRVIEIYGKHCKTCGNDLFARDTSIAKYNFLADILVHSENIVDSLIDDKFNETDVKIKKDLNEIFSNLNVLIEEVEKGNTDIANLKPIQEEILKMINVEKQELEALKNKAPQSTIKDVLNLINKSHDLLKTIDEKVIAIKALVHP